MMCTSYRFIERDQYNQVFELVGLLMMCTSYRFIERD